MLANSKPSSHRATSPGEMLATFLSAPSPDVTTGHLPTYSFSVNARKPCFLLLSIKTRSSSARVIDLPSASMRAIKAVTASSRLASNGFNLLDNSTAFEMKASSAVVATTWPSFLTFDFWAETQAFACDLVLKNLRSFLPSTVR